MHTYLDVCNVYTCIYVVYVRVWTHEYHMYVVYVRECGCTHAMTHM